MMNIDPDTFSSLVKEAGSQSEVRQDLVDAFKSLVAVGSYPSQQTMDGLAQTIGGGIYQLATTSSASSN